MTLFKQNGWTGFFYTKRFLRTLGEFSLAPAFVQESVLSPRRDHEYQGLLSRSEGRLPLYACFAKVMPNLMS